MKLYRFLFILLAATPTQTSSPTSMVQQTGVNLPVIYIQNNTESDSTLTSFTILYSYYGSNEEFSTTSTTSIKLPSKTVTSINSSMKISQTSNKTPEFKEIKNIEINGKTIVAPNRLIGLDPREPIVIN